MACKHYFGNISDGLESSLPIYWRGLTGLPRDFRSDEEQARRVCIVHRIAPALPCQDCRQLGSVASQPAESAAIPFHVNGWLTIFIYNYFTPNGATSKFDHFINNILIITFIFLK
jgi:hypothetical protein